MIDTSDMTVVTPEVFRDMIDRVYALPKDQISESKAGDRIFIDGKYLVFEADDAQDAEVLLVSMIGGLV